MNARTLSCALIALMIAPSAGLAASRTIGEAGVAVSQIKRPPEDAPRVLTHQPPVRFVKPPLDTGQPAVIIPPFVTFRSDPKLRAQYPPVSGAKTVSQSFHETFGELVKVTFTLSGQDEELLIRNASTRALLAVAARAYFLDRALMAQDLLPQYLDLHSDRFVRRKTVSNRVVNAGQPQFDLSLTVDQDLLLKDLEEKRFIYEPKFRPFFFVCLDQTINGAPDTDKRRGFKAAISVLQDRDVRFAEHGAPSLEKPDSDIGVSEQVFLQARPALQGNAIEVVLTGKMTTRMADLDATISEEDWTKNTVQVDVASKDLAAPAKAHLPLKDLLAKLDETLAARKAATSDSRSAWWDVNSIEQDVPLEAMDLSESVRATLKDSGATFKAQIPVTRIGMKRNYYTAFHQAVTRLDMKLIRVDTGEILAEVHDQAVGNDKDRDRAIQLSIEKVVGRSTNALVDEFNQAWPKIMQDKADFKVLASRVTAQDIKVLTDLIQRSDPRAEVRVRSHLGDVAVLNLIYPAGRDSLMRILTRADDPRFHVVSEKKKSLEIERL